MITGMQSDQKDVNDGRGELSGRVAVVTGATKGIGRAIALELADAGARVVIHGHRGRDAAHQLAGTLRSRGRGAHVLLADLSQMEDQDRVIEEAWAWRGGVDIWVNNAGVDVLTGTAAQATFENKMERLWRVDVVATVRLSRLAGDRMRQNGGVILNMGWDQAEQGMGGDSGELFAAVKGAVIAFTRSLAQSLAPSVRVNCLAPGWIRTDWGREAPPTWQARACGDALLSRWGTPEDVARTARFLVGPAGAFVNGQVVAVNGGFRYGPRPAP